MSRIIAETLEMDREFIEILFVTAPLHDIGKIGIPDSILMKEGALSSEDWEVMKQHCRIGARILQEQTRAKSVFQEWLGTRGEVDGQAGDNPILQTAANIALMHHEKWDGSGYPQGLAGEHIPLEARIAAIADVFDALTSRRPYKAAYPEDEALQIIHDTAGSHFDPQVYAAFLESLPAIHSVRERLSDGVNVFPVPEEARDEAAIVRR